MSGYRTKDERIAISGVADLTIRSLLDRQQFHDPDGRAERAGISSAAWPLFGMLWPSGAQLAARMGRRSLVPGERVLEVGCGLALASLVGHRRGADMTASDCHPLAGHFLRDNLRLNGLPPMKYRLGPWVEASGPLPRRQVRGAYDLIIGSDLLYERDSSAALAGFIGRHAAASTEVWLVDPDRGNRSGFNRLMAALGFRVGDERIDVPADANVAAYKGRLLTYVRA